MKAMFYKSSIIGIVFEDNISLLVFLIKQLYMNRLLLVAMFMLACSQANAQERKPLAKKEPPKNDLVDIKKCITEGQGSVELFTRNYKDNSLEHDVNSIILDIEKYIDSMHGVRLYSDQVLMKQFNPLRHFFLTTTNKTSVATSFLYSVNPYRFCMYNDTATALYISAVKDGDAYNLGKTTEKRITKFALENCLLPSLKALDEFKDNDIKYVGLSIYYGCKDAREGAPPVAITPYCLTLVARLADIQQYNAGIITAKGLLANAELYLSDADTGSDLRRVRIDVE